MYNLLVISIGLKCCNKFNINCSKDKNYNICKYHKLNLDEEYYNFFHIFSRIL